MTARNVYEAIYQGLHETTEPWGGCDDRELVERVGDAALPILEAIEIGARRLALADALEVMEVTGNAAGYIALRGYISAEEGLPS